MCEQPAASEPPKTGASNKLLRFVAHLLAAAVAIVAGGGTALDAAVPEAPKPVAFVTVTGPVRAPGKIPWTPELTVRGALKRCGGIGFRDSTWVYIVRGAERIPVRTRTLYGAIQQPPLPQHDPPLQPNDVLEVPE